MHHYCILLLAYLFTGVTISQTTQINTIPVSFGVPEIAILKIQPSTEPVVLSLETITEAGNAISGKSIRNNDKWINYSSSIIPDGVTRSITVEILSGSVPLGTEITLTTGYYSGNGKGKLGTPLDEIALSNYPQKILTGIGGGYTKTGSNNGHSLTYDIKIKNYDLLKFETDKTLFISYTITDD